MGDRLAHSAIWETMFPGDSSMHPVDQRTTSITEIHQLAKVSET